MTPPPSTGDCRRWTTALAFTMTGHDGTTSPARLSRVDGSLSLAIDEPRVLDGLQTLVTLHRAAQGFADQGVLVRVTHDGTPLLSLGAIDATAQESAASGSVHIVLADRHLNGSGSAGRVPAIL